ncbi:MAG: hypothetical protein ABFD50_16020, partial [Smithella sp.]
DEAISKERKIIFKSPYICPRFELDMMGSLIREQGGRIWIRTVSGVYAVNPSDIKYQYSKD